MPNLPKICLLLLLSGSFFSCGTAQKGVEDESTTDIRQVEQTEAIVAPIKVAADRYGEYIPLIQNKTLAVVSNATSMTESGHLVDVLLSNGVQVKKVFAPEHGFRGEADAGEHVDDETDQKTGLPIISLYGKNKKPSASSLEDVDVILFDIQDVGVRFYTYLSTLHYVMEAAAQSQKEVIILDRPNPNGFYIDGPVLEEGYESFVGLHPVPIVYGMTIGEYGKMINGEGWLEDGVKCNLTVIACENYTHMSYYELPIRPSPNLPNMASVYLYPSLALFEGTVVSVGRGTDHPFQCVGHPDFSEGPFAFTPEPNGGARYPKLEGEQCKGMDLRTYGEFYSKQSKKMYLFWLIGFHQDLDKSNFFLESNFFNLLAGNGTLKQQIQEGKTEEEIRKTWQEGLIDFKSKRKKYLIYN